ncbi:hypothetical protein ZIOFF_033683 [Zingiber officinale]|uniref:Uncharacterized protein n=1 Tax=Zingiber officinale TaxID=94328 RepID=A0A8J5L1Y6_ZINOF|nr:hypothetical protein ZIOFF_033683 [Zingiber officinale]
MEGGEGERVVAVPQLSPAEGGGGWAPSRIRKRKTWTAEEDAVLAEHVRVHGTGNWDTVPKSTGLARTGQCCRSRWLNTLRPGLKKDGASFSRDEELQLCRLHAALGNKWSRIAAQMAGRSENECMNYWKTYVKRCQHAGVNVYPPEVQDAGGKSDLHQPQHQRQKVQSSPLQPPPSSSSSSSMLPLEYLNNPVVAGYRGPVTVLSPHLPVTEEMQLHNGQFLASLSSDPSIDRRSLQPQPFETAEGFDFENFRDLPSTTSINVYPPEEQEAAGEPELNQQQDKRHKGQNFPLPPPLPSMLPLVSQMPQPLVAVYPAPVTSSPTPLPVTAEVPLHNDQSSASLLPLPSDPSADQMSLQLQTPPFSGFSFEDILDAYRRVKGI